MIIKVMFHIPMKLKSELARASMTTSDVNNQWRSNFQQQIINTNKIHNEKFNYIKFWCDLNIIIRIECILLKLHWGMKALIELHFQHERYRASLKMYFGHRFHTPMKLQKNAFNS
jgi:hypothetical protein